MKINEKRIKNYLYDIKNNTNELKNILEQNNDETILNNPFIIKSIKYTLIEIAEAMSNTLQHILAKGLGKPVSGYLDTLNKAKIENIISEKLHSALKPFFEFRNALIHRYWIMDDSLILKNLRNGYKDFFTFIEQIEKKVSEIK